MAELEAVVAAKGWALKKNFRSSWCSFSAENGRVAFGVALGKGNIPYLYIKRVQSEANRFPAKLLTYNETYDQAEFALDPGAANLETFLPLLSLAYSRISK
ncbi:MAG: hypothetical protein ABI835_03380 [Chloroflexota bacterium]